jgi:signal transduction histidine kinase
MVAYITFKYGFFSLDDLAQAAHRDKLTAIGVLAASINHEVKNPLFIIKGLAESCLERQKEGVFTSDKKALESANDAMKRSTEQADRAMDIIKRLSLFAKAGIDSEIKFEPVKVAQVIEDILPLVRYELAAHGIALTRDLPPDLPEVRADRRYLEEILFNLIVNACQAMSDGGEIEMTAETVIARSPAFRGTTRQSQNEIASPSGFAMTDAQPGPVTIAIRDTGPGLAQDQLKRIFEPFYTTKASGTGLGLYVVKQLVEKNGGRVEVSSKEGLGTTFTLVFLQ